MPVPLSKLRRRYCDNGWARSRKGNLWRRLEDGETVTVFERLDDFGELRGYGFCIYCDNDGATFSRELYESEGEAVEATWYTLRDWGWV